ncbi:MAG: peptidoglycan DD-metalloendopeptidase family protein [Pseudomonadota bacterium]
MSDPVKLAFGPGQPGSEANGSESVGQAALPGLKPIRVKVKSGDSLYGILKRRGLRPGVLPALLSVGKDGRRLERIRPGEALELYIDDAGLLQRLEYKPNALTTVSYRRQGDGFASTLLETPLLARERKLSGEIESSLFLDGQRAGLSDRVIMQLAEIFGWDVDFALDIRNGDRFTVVHEELFDGSRKVRDGNILAAEFINQGRVFRAVRFVNPDGEARYYTPDGRSMRKAFLRTPVRFARISSRFNLRRKHPILHKVRAHKGVDYAAPSGTPVKATGDGRIEFRGRKRGYGNTVIIRHSGGVYSTLYAHLKGFSRKVRHGSYVKQGQVIGYVGQTGLATGPHLHYEFRVRGKHKDPLRVRLPKSLPIPGRYKQAFKQQTRRWLARLGSDGARVAGNH